MCGILAAVGNFPKPLFEKSLERLAHRGPDGSEIWTNTDHNILFGHRRLAIIDLSDTGKQPMTDGNLTITYNGEIYNYIELKNELETRGHQFRTHSDTEVILKAYREWGHSFLTKLNGMWAFVIWDNDERKLLISRDRFGVKPLFYAFTLHGFLCGSEMKALAPLLDQVSYSRDFEWCKKNIYEYETSDRCLIEGIKRFPAGHYAELRQGDRFVSPVRFWNTIDHLEEVDQDYQKQVSRFRELFYDSCKIRMRSDVKIGTALSGGLDSSSVAAAMHQLGKASHRDAVQSDWQNAFVATFEGTPLDERIYAEEIINSYSLQGHYFEIDPVKGLDRLSEYLWFFEELFLTSPIPMIEVYKGIKKHGVSVSLDGHGADELFSGYGTMLLNAIKDRPFDLQSIQKIIATYKGTYGIDKSDVSVWIDGFAGRKNLVKHYFSKVFQLDEDDPLVKKLGHFNAALYKEFHFYILPTLLRNYDRYSMAAGVEVRMPFMDYRLVSYCFSLPWSSKLRNGYTKAILRDAMQPVLPQKIATRKTKTGFGTPFQQWLSGPWKEYILDTIESGSFKNSQVIDSKETRKSVLSFYAKKNPSWDDGNQVWEQLMPYFWEISFLKKLA